MNMKSISDFVKENDCSENLHDYIYSFLDDKKVIQSFMLEFDEPSFLAGPYGDKYGLILIKDHRLGSQKLLPEITLYNKWADRLSANLYNIPHHILEELELGSKEYISGYYDQTTGSPITSDDYNSDLHYCMFEENIDPDSESLKHPFLKKHVCAPGKFNPVELISAFELMLKKDGVEKTLLSLAEMKKKIQEGVNRFERRSCVSIEKPLYLSVVGTDDSSWGASFKNLQDLDFVSTKIKESPNFNTVHKFLDFTN